jgi:hypothetical protein
LPEAAELRLPACPLPPPAVARRLLLLSPPAAASFPPAGGWRPLLGDWGTPVLTADNATWEHDAVQEPQVQI